MQNVVTEVSREKGPPRATRAPAGGSAARVGRIHDAMLRHLESGRLPGLVVLVSRRGEAHVDAIGALAVGRAAPIAA
jgi:hypothetical protein